MNQRLILVSAIAAIAASSPVLAREDVPVPTTINGITMGEPENYETMGPARVCISGMAFDLEENDRAFLAYTGIHAGQLRIFLRDRYFDLTVGDIFLEPPKGKRVSTDQPFRIYESGGDEAEYLIFNLDEWEEDGGPQQEWRFSARLEGDAFHFDWSDRRILSRLTKVVEEEECDTVYDFGFPIIFGEEPYYRKSNDE